VVRHVLHTACMGCCRTCFHECCWVASQSPNHHAQPHDKSALEHHHGAVRPPQYAQPPPLPEKGKSQQHGKQEHFCCGMLHIRMDHTQRGIRRTDHTYMNHATETAVRCISMDVSRTLSAAEACTYAVPATSNAAPPAQNTGSQLPPVPKGAILKIVTWQVAAVWLICPAGQLQDGPSPDSRADSRAHQH
jgi:hypothetical protein